MRVLAIAAVVGGCQMEPAPMPATPPPSRITTSIATSIDATAPSADTESELDFVGSGVPIGFAGITLGGAMPAEPPSLGTSIGTFEGTRVELGVFSDDDATVSQINVRLLDDRTAMLTKRFGPAKRNTWKGAASWMLATIGVHSNDGDFVTWLSIVPPDEHHECGAADGFASFYAGVEHAIRAGDWVTVSRAMAFPRTEWLDGEGDDVAVELGSAADFLASPRRVFKFPLRGGRVTCDIVDRMYTVQFGTARLAPTIYIAREHGAWKIVNVGHAPHDLF